MIYHRFKIEISEAEMEAFLTIYPREGADSTRGNIMPDADYVFTYLEMSGIKHGINHKAIQRLVCNRMLGETIQIARGTKPITGSDGRVEYFFQNKPKSQPDTLDRKYQPYELSAKSSYVEKGDLLARVIPPTNGSEGLTVTGKKVGSGINGSDVYIVAGRNTYFGDTDERELRASKAGLVSKQGETVHVDGAFLIETNVDPTTGDVEFPGDIIILRNVRSGVQIKSGGKIILNGNLRDSHLTASGDIEIKGDFGGAGQGKVYANEDIRLRSIENQTAKADGSIHITKKCLNANLSAGKSIIMERCKEGIIGGHLRAAWNIVAEKVGDKNNTSTILEVLESADYDALIKGAEREINLIEKQLRDIETEIESLNDFEFTKDSGELQISERLYAAQKEREACRSKLSDCRERRQAMEAKQRELGKPGTIHIKSEVYTGTKIIIENTVFEVKEKLNEVIFRKSGDEICVFELHLASEM